MMDAPLDTPASFPGYAPLTPFQNTALLHAARLCVMQARGEIAARAPRKAVTLWRWLVATSHVLAPFGRGKFPPPISFGAPPDVSTIAIICLKPLRDVCAEIPAESARLIAVLVAQAILTECLRAQGSPAEPAREKER